MFSSLKGSPSLKSASEPVHSASRRGAKFALDVLGLIRINEIETKSGSVWPKVESELGKVKFEALCSDARLTLLSVQYCQRGIEGLRDSSTREAVAQGSKVSSAGSPRAPRMENVGQTCKAMRAIINHDYLVLKIRPGDSNMEEFLIVADKVLDPEETGIHIKYVRLKDESSWVNEGVLNYAIPCDKEISLKKIIKVLEEGDPHYNLRHANCWDYATTAAKRLVKECAHVPGISKDENTRLEREHDNLEANLASNHILNTLTMFVNQLFSSFSSGSADRSTGMNSKAVEREPLHTGLPIGFEAPEREPSLTGLPVGSEAFEQEPSHTELPVGSRETACESSGMTQNVVAGTQNNVVDARRILEILVVLVIAFCVWWS